MAVFPNLSGNNPINAPAVDKFVEEYFVDRGTTVVTVTPSDTVDLVGGMPAFVVATVAGVISMLMGDNSTALVPFAAGIPQKISPKRIQATGTTATGIIVIY